MPGALFEMHRKRPMGEKAKEAKAKAAAHGERGFRAV